MALRRNRLPFWRRARQAAALGRWRLLRSLRMRIQRYWRISYSLPSISYAQEEAQRTGGLGRATRAGRFSLPAASSSQRQRLPAILATGGGKDAGGWRCWAFLSRGFISQGDGNVTALVTVAALACRAGLFPNRRLSPPASTSSLLRLVARAACFLAHLRVLYFYSKKRGANPTPVACRWRFATLQTASLARPLRAGLTLRWLREDFGSTPVALLATGQKAAGLTACYAPSFPMLLSCCSQDALLAFDGRRLLSPARFALRRRAPARWRAAPSALITALCAWRHGQAAGRRWAGCRHFAAGHRKGSSSGQAWWGGAEDAAWTSLC